ncbi:MAG TPA: hypothetical protein VLX92_25680 [Kofleriaceae bacterium]|nr:hypothetical protein [Kofleriaceae bacterium]
MSRLAPVLVLASLVTGCFREHRDCREHESWDGHYCHADRGYEHYWDHPDHRDWHPDEHHQDHPDDHH